MINTTNKQNDDAVIIHSFERIVGAYKLHKKALFTCMSLPFQPICTVHYSSFLFSQRNQTDLFIESFRERDFRHENHTRSVIWNALIVKVFCCSPPILESRWGLLSPSFAYVWGVWQEVPCSVPFRCVYCVWIGRSLRQDYSKIGYICERGVVWHFIGFPDSLYLATFCRRSAEDHGALPRR